MVDWLVRAVSDIPAEWAVFFLSMLPVAELRLSIPLGVAWGLSPAQAFFWGLGGNFLPIIPLLLLLDYVLRWMSRFRLFAPLIMRLQAHNQRRQRWVRSYGAIGLALFVAVPLPGTGVWSGCLIASLLGMRFWPAVAAVTAGGIVAGLLVTAITSGALAVFRLAYGEYILAGLLLLAAALWFIRRQHK